MVDKWEKFRAELLRQVPEIAPEHERVRLDEVDDVRQMAGMSVADFEILYDHLGMKPSDFLQPAITIFLEDAFMKFIRKLVEEGNLDRLAEVFRFIEAEVSGDDPRVVNAIGVTICEKLVTSDDDYLPAVFPFMGQATRDACRLSCTGFRVSETTLKLFNEA